MIPRNCLECSKEFLARPAEVKRNKAKFCSRQCAAKQPRQPRVNKDISNTVCAYCDKQFFRQAKLKKKTSSGKYFCCLDHKNKAQTIESGILAPSHYTTGESSYRRIAFSNLENKCEDCDYNKRIDVLQVHHKDRDRENNKLENLIILCPTCHRIRHIDGV